MKQPAANDFEVKVLTGGVQVNFNPTFSYYWFDRLVEPHEIEKLGLISPAARIRHMGWAGDTGDYPADDVALIAYRLAAVAAAEAYKKKPSTEAEQPPGAEDERAEHRSIHGIDFPTRPAS
jgi:hypothetical protein